jgi:DNA (cytosine-5)-methyltransferase 1
MKGFTLFSGFEGVGIGMKAAGIEHVGGIEYDDTIASVARENGFEVTTADVLTADPDNYPGMDLLHASPPCPNFSTAKANGVETEQDIALAQAAVRWIVIKRPSFFTLENVYQYRDSQSWSIIARALLEHGYLFNCWHVNTADYGVPQTRKRMIVIARRDGRMPLLPPAAHAENPQNGLFGTLLPWVGWYEAIEDLIPSLPDSQFAPWQLSRLPEELKTVLVDSAGYPDEDGIRVAVQRDCEQPANTIVSNYERRPMRAFVVSGNNAGNEWGEFFRNDDIPAYVVASSAGRGATRAFVVNSAFPESNGKKHYVQDEPHFTIDTTTPGRSRAFTNGRIVQMTPRALARFQSFPDWYRLPDNKALACRGIGNAVPPLFYQRLAEVIQ